MRLKHICLATVLLLSASAPSQAMIMRTSWYGSGSHLANGERFNPERFVAAHKSYPFGTVLAVTNRRNGHSVNVIVKDRGPFVRGRSLDVSRGAAKALGMIGEGVASLEVQVLSIGNGARIARGHRFSRERRSESWAMEPQFVSFPIVPFEKHRIY